MRARNRAKRSVFLRENVANRGHDRYTSRLESPSTMTAFASVQGIVMMSFSPFRPSAVARVLSVLVWVCVALTSASAFAEPRRYGGDPALDAGDYHACGLMEDGEPACRGLSANTWPREPFVQISSGFDHACALRGNGQIVCWGAAASVATPPPPGAYLMVSAGNADSCAIRGDGAIRCWGGELSTNAPTTGAFVDLAVGTGRACAIRGDGTLHCWQAPGYAGFGAAPSGRFVSVAIGTSHACALRSDGKILCWGSNAQGQTAAPTAPNFVAVTAGHQHACGIRDDGGIVCWGANASGQLNVPSGKYVAVSAGRSHTCAREQVGAIRCWGAQAGSEAAPELRLAPTGIAAGDAHTCTVRGDHGVGCWGDKALVQKVETVQVAQSISANADHTCTQRAGEGALCWGDNLHDGSTPPATPLRALDLGQFNGCGVTATGSASCWGWNVNAQSTPPADLFRRVATGLNHSCGVRDDGTLACWGYNADGQATPPTGTYASVDVGERHSCALTETGVPTCWGLNTEGQATPPDLGGATYRALSVGAFHTCGILSHGGIACWGRNANGQSTPPEEGQYVSIASGTAHTCAVRDDGGRVCWGANESGQAPQPTIGPAVLPTLVNGEYARIDFSMDASGGYVAPNPRFALLDGDASLKQLEFNERGELRGVPRLSPGVYSVAIEARDENGFVAKRNAQLSVVDAVDTTPPVITPVFTGTLGENNWYISDVQLTWSITDPESPITSTIGCQPATLTIDTSPVGQIMGSCTATSAGGQTSSYPSARRDASPPGVSAALLAPPDMPNAAGWYKTTVTRVFNCIDYHSDIVACPTNTTLSEDSATATFPAQIVRDYAGNSTTVPAVVIKLDRTPPTLLVTPDGTPNADGWYGQLTLRFTCSDALSGLAEPCPAPLPLYTSSTSSFTHAGGNLTDIAGNTTSTFGDYKVDTWMPNLSIPALPNPILLNSTATQVVPIASDVHSGLASASCTPLETATVGTKTITCTAIDRVGNVATRTASYAVVYDFVPLAAPLGSSASQAYLVQAPRSVPFEFRLRDANGAAVLNATLDSVRTTAVACPSNILALTTPPAGETDSFAHRDDGVYRRNWWINYTATGCLRLDMTLNDGVTRSATIRVVPKTLRTGGNYPSSRPPTPTSNASPSRPVQTTPATSTSSPSRGAVNPRRPDLQKRKKK